MPAALIENQLTNVQLGIKCTIGHSKLGIGDWKLGIGDWGLGNRLEGPRDFGKYKISSDYWKKWPLLKLFDFVKVVRNIDISNLEPKTLKCFFANVF